MERTAVNDGVRLLVRDHGGSGTPVVLLHGLAGHSGEWDETAAWLREAHRVVVFDQRAHGASERCPADVSRAAYVSDVVAVIDALRLGRALLVGQSLGGHTAMLAAAARPDLVRALVMIEAAPGDAAPGLPEDIENRLASWPVPFRSREAAVGFFGGGPVGTSWAAGLAERRDGWWPRFEPGFMVRSVAELSRRSFWPEWRMVRCPALVVLAESGMFPAGAAREIARDRPSTHVVTVPGAGHDVHLEKPEPVRAAITEFLRELGA
ncbi:alpha/beta fold hydrolase [Actinoallomurus soli]|uniref:alpha/beta fold hydrolase n=1 Tax=Actinoallomurus soli TaxID=2952535 RepID=UPI002093F745|nr:alpha/beta hydrolase [Actinoallomurus soli]MCO5970228.1 alpha/beta hydrolase [Actinoallomurus soli]